MPLDTRNKNTYGLGVGILTIFKLFVHFLFEGSQDHPQGSSPIYHLMPLNTWNKNIYGLGVRILTVSEIYGHFQFLGVGMTPGLTGLSLKIGVEGEMKKKKGVWGSCL